VKQRERASFEEPMRAVLQGWYHCWRSGVARRNEAIFSLRRGPFSPPSDPSSLSLAMGYSLGPAHVHPSSSLLRSSVAVLIPPKLRHSSICIIRSRRIGPKALAGNYTADMDIVVVVVFSSMKHMRPRATQLISPSCPPSCRSCRSCLPSTSRDVPPFAPTASPSVPQDQMSSCA
jgi:hypothetical protein